MKDTNLVCDICDRKIKGPWSTMTLTTPGFIKIIIHLDVCEDCRDSFKIWKMERKATFNAAKPEVPKTPPTQLDSEEYKKYCEAVDKGEYIADPRD
jgi:hypothetical protein